MSLIKAVEEASSHHRRAQPLHTLQAVVVGTASSGVLVSLLRIATKAALPGTTAGLRASAGEAHVTHLPACQCAAKSFASQRC